MPKKTSKPGGGNGSLPLLDSPGSLSPDETPAASSTLPPPLPALSYDLFRQKLLGLADPQRQGTAAEKVAVKDSAVRLCSVLAHLFGDALDRLTLWSKIDAAFQAAHAKTSDDDLDRFCDLCLETVQADPGRAAACDALSSLRGEWASWPPETRHAFLGYVGSHRFALLAHGRARWERIKRKECDL